MAKKITRLLINVFFLFMLASCTQANGGDPVLPEIEPRELKDPGTEIDIEWLQYDVYKTDFLHGGNYAFDFMVIDFMNDNLAIPDIDTAEMIINGRIDPWIVPEPVPPTP